MDLSVREVATLLDVSVRTVRARLQRGELPGRKVEGTWRIQRQDVPLTEDQLTDKVTVLSVAALLGEGIKRIHRNESVSRLFVE